MLLQALDLLDRGLVVRIVEQSIEATNGNPTQAQDQEKVDPTAVSIGDEATTTETGREIFPPQANIHLPSSPPLPGLQPQSTSTSQLHQQAPLPVLPPKSKYKPSNAFYQVRSSQPPKSRFRDASSSTSNSSGNIYTVRLGAWNCSCAAFAFASFPANSVYPSKSPWTLDVGHEEDVDLDGSGEESNEEGGEEGKWEFGGMSRDGNGAEAGGGGGGGGVPCCKHLLACVLGERWGVLREYVKERIVSKEEMAGLKCE